MRACVYLVCMFLYIVHVYILVYVCVFFIMPACGSEGVWFTRVLIIEITSHDDRIADLVLLLSA